MKAKIEEHDMVISEEAFDKLPHDLQISLLRAEVRQLHNEVATAHGWAQLAGAKFKEEEEKNKHLTHRLGAWKRYEDRAIGVARQLNKVLVSIVDSGVLDAKTAAQARAGLQSFKQQNERRFEYEP